MNSGLWISFPLSTGRGWRCTVPLAVAAQTPPRLILAGAA